MRRPLVCVTRLWQQNIGDMHASPKWNVAWLNGARVLDPIDFKHSDPQGIQGAHLIVGGGGVLGQGSELAKLTDAHAASTVVWGAGLNEPTNRRPNIGDMPAYLANYDLVGIRDSMDTYPPNARWVPCATTLNSAFDRREQFTVERDVVVFEHLEYPMDIPGIPKNTNENTGQSFDDVLSFLGSGMTVLTNSYHGALWATMLGRRVALCFPPTMLDRLSNKYLGYRHQPPVTPTSEWRNAITAARAFPEALSECRAAGESFSADVTSLVAERNAQLGDTLPPQMTSQEGTSLARP